MSSSSSSSPSSFPVSTSWQEDSTVSACPVCRFSFGFTFRKHHCRICGLIFCDNDSSKKALIGKEMVRCCDQCHGKWNEWRRGKDKEKGKQSGGNAHNANNIIPSSSSSTSPSAASSSSSSSTSPSSTPTSLSSATCLSLLTPPPSFLPPHLIPFLTPTISSSSSSSSSPSPSFILYKSQSSCPRCFLIDRLPFRLLPSSVILIGGKVYLRIHCNIHQSLPIVLLSSDARYFASQQYFFHPSPLTIAPPSTSSSSSSLPSLSLPYWHPYHSTAPDIEDIVESIKYKGSKVRAFSPTMVANLTLDFSNHQGDNSGNNNPSVASPASPSSSSSPSTSLSPSTSSSSTPTAPLIIDLPLYNDLTHIFYSPSHLLSTLLLLLSPLSSSHTFLLRLQGGFFESRGEVDIVNRRAREIAALAVNVDEWRAERKKNVMEERMIARMEKGMDLTEEEEEGAEGATEAEVEDIIDASDLLSLHTRLHRSMILIELSADRLIDLSSLPTSVLTKSRVIPSVKYFIEIGDEDNVVDEMRTLVTALQDFEDIQLVVNLSVEYPMPNLGNIMKFLMGGTVENNNNNNNICKWIVITRERSPKDILMEAMGKDVKLQKIRVREVMDEGEGKGQGAERENEYFISDHPADIHAVLHSLSSSLATLSSVPSSVSSSPSSSSFLTPHDFIPLRCLHLLSSLSQLIGGSEISFTLSPHCSSFILMLPIPSSVLSSSSYPHSYIPFSRLFNLHSLYHSLLSILSKLKESHGKLGIFTAKSLLKSFRDSQSPSTSHIFPLPDLTSLVDIDSPTSPIRLSLSAMLSSLVVVVIHNLMDVGTMDAVRRCECGNVRRGKEGAGGIIATCTGCF